MDRLGLLSGASKHRLTRQSIQANAAIIEKTAEEAAVLLKNDDAILPLKAADLDSVVLIGPHRRSGGRHRHQWRTIAGPAPAPDRPPGRP